MPKHRYVDKDGDPIWTPFGSVNAEGLTPMPKHWTRRVDNDYKAFLRGQRLYPIKCTFVTPEGEVINGPCQLLKDTTMLVPVTSVRRKSC